jgi:hypothetical protein
MWCCCGGWRHQGRLSAHPTSVLIGLHNLIPGASLAGEPAKHAARAALHRQPVTDGHRPKVIDGRLGAADHLGCGWVCGDETGQRRTSAGVRCASRSLNGQACSKRSTHRAPRQHAHTRAHLRQQARRQLLDRPSHLGLNRVQPLVPVSRQLLARHLCVQELGGVAVLHTCCWHALRLRSSPRVQQPPQPPLDVCVSRSRPLAVPVPGP